MRAHRSTPRGARTLGVLAATNMLWAAASVGCHRTDQAHTATTVATAIIEAPSSQHPEIQPETERATTESAREATAESEEMKILILVDGEQLGATLEGNPTARAFAEMLPLELELSDYASTEKISHLDAKLTTRDAPEGLDPTIGDITYYAPWGNMAIFYRDFGYARGLVKIGHIDSGIEKLGQKKTDFTVRFERASTSE